MTPEAIDALFEAQTAAWPDLDRGVESLERAARRAFEIRGARVVAVHIPHRVASTTAPVDPGAIRKRPCFLCPENRPAAQTGIAFGPDMVVLANPFPILERHVTLVHREHAPQRITGPSGVGAMLDAARALPGYVVIYNGPRSGASAPDHLHFQAGRSRGLPLVEGAGGAVDGMLTDPWRAVLVVAGDDPEDVEAGFRRLMSPLAARSPEADEPRVNVIVTFEGGRWTLLLFPRARHRPAAFHEGRLTWSPGAIDMAGLVVLPVAGDLEKLTADDIETVYREVSLPIDAAREILAREESS